MGITPFASRHSAWYYYGGLSEIYDTGKYGSESAHEITPIALDWIERNGDRDNWYLHINLWDPHTPYRTPADFENPFQNDPLPSWITEEVLQGHLKLAGPHCAQEIGMYTDFIPKQFPLQPGRLDTMEDVKKLFDGYDMGIRYADEHVGKIIDALKKKGVYDDMVIIISSDHGENMGELGIYAEHGTADHATCRIPFILKWPNGKKGITLDGLHGNIDLIPTLAEMLEIKPSSQWDGESFASSILDGIDHGRKFLVISQMAHVCERSVRFGDYLYMRTYHDGFHFFPKHMLFNLKEDPYEEHNLADEYPEIVNQCSSILFDWHDEMMKKNDYREDPMLTVLKEGGPFHANHQLKEYSKYLIKTGREHYIEEYKKIHPKEFK